MTLADKIKVARLTAGLSQAQLAEKLYVSRSAIAKWENGHGKPDLDNLKQLALTLQVTVDSLLDDGQVGLTTRLREPISWADYPRQKGRTHEEVVVLKLCPKLDTLYRLQWDKAQTKWWHFVWWFTGPWGWLALESQDAYDLIQDRAVYFLGQEAERQFLLRVDQEFLTKQSLPHKVNPWWFHFDGLRFSRISGNRIKIK